MKLAVAKHPVKTKSYLSNLGKQIIKNKYIYLILLPGVMYYIIFSYVPMYGIQLAFKDFMINKGILGSPFVGLDKFKYVLADDLFWRAFKNTLIISFGKLIFVFPVPILLAILINEVSDGRFKKFMQTVFTFPHFLSWVIVSGIVLNIFNSTGAINNLISTLGFEKQNFLVNLFLFRPLLFITEAWKETGWSSIIYLAAITTINPEIYEAAVLDGANRFQKIFHITWPGIKSTVVILLILTIGSTMTSGFDQIFNLYNPVVYAVSDIIDTYIYRVTFQGSTDFGFSTAMGLFKSVINFALLLSANKIAKKLGNEGLL